MTQGVATAVGGSAVGGSAVSVGCATRHMRERVVHSIGDPRCMHRLLRYTGSGVSRSTLDVADALESRRAAARRVRRGALDRGILMVSAVQSHLSTLNIC